MMKELESTAARWTRALLLLSAALLLTGLGARATGPIGVDDALVTASASAATPVWSTYGTQADAQLGISVASAGDVNGDGYGDVIVGAWYQDQYSGPLYDRAGAAYLFYGSADGLSTTPDWTATPPSLETNGFFGVVVGSAGDVNGDTFDDVFVTMTNYNGSWSDEGAIFVWYGSESGLGSSYNWMARGNSTYAHLGWDAGTAGDVNGDGYDDLIVGAYRYDSAAASNAYVWLGSDTGLGANGTPANADWTASSDKSLKAFGTHVGTAGDVNGDGYDEVFVAAPLYDDGQADEGVVFVWHGSDTGLGANGTPSNADWRAQSDQASAQFSGRWNTAPQEGGVGTAGDVNGDGYDDFMVGSALYDSPDADEGAIFVWYGSDTGLGENGTPTNADWQAQGDQAGAWFASGASTAGDMNGDGYDDIVVGACYYDLLPDINVGLVAVWFGAAGGLGTDGTPANAPWWAHGVGGGYGWVVNPAGDVDDDGYSEIAVGAFGDDTVYGDAGAAYVYEYVPVAADFSASPTSGIAPLLVHFTNLSSGYDTCTWDFGDGGSSTACSDPDHTYHAGGTYTVTLTVSGPGGTDEEIKADLIAVEYGLYLPLVLRAD